MSEIVPLNKGDGEVEGKAATSQFRYSKAKFQTNFFIALALTGMVCFFTWLLFNINGSYRATLYTFLVGTVFFAFISVNMLRQYIQNDVILAVRPNGLLDTRWSGEPVAWDDIKEISLQQTEDEFELSVWLWPKGNKTTPISANVKPTAKPTFSVDLQLLDAKPSYIVALVNHYYPVKIDQ